MDIVFLPTAPEVGAAEFLHKLAEHGEVIEPADKPLGTMVLHASDVDDEIGSARVAEVSALPSTVSATQIAHPCCLCTRECCPSIGRRVLSFQ